MKERAHHHNGCFWRYASLKRPAKPTRDGWLTHRARNNLRAGQEGLGARSLLREAAPAARAKLERARRSDRNSFPQAIRARRNNHEASQSCRPITAVAGRRAASWTAGIKTCFCADRNERRIKRTVVVCATTGTPMASSRRFGAASAIN